MKNTNSIPRKSWDNPVKKIVCFWCSVFFVFFAPRQFQSRRYKEAGPQKTGPGAPPLAQNFGEPLSLRFCMGVLRKVPHSRKPAEEPSHRTPKVPQNSGRQAQLFRPLSKLFSLPEDSLRVWMSRRAPDPQNGLCLLPSSPSRVTPPAVACSCEQSQRLLGPSESGWFFFHSLMPFPMCNSANQKSRRS